MQGGAKPAIDGGFWVRAREREQGGPRMTRTRNRDTEAARIDEVLSAGDPPARSPRAQADPPVDTVAKRLARHFGDELVRCPCGAEFPAAVRRP